ncbi:MAG: hypothetical protein ACOWYE_15530 [Desulfatiglandales bacterium]
MENKVFLKLITIVFILITSMSLPVDRASADWLVFHKPPYKGKVLDAEKNEPIEDVVVVAMYYTASIIGTPAGGYSTNIKVKETSTNHKGEFYFPSYTTMTGPNSKESLTEFIIYKPGYGSCPNNLLINPPPDMGLSNMEMYFLAENFGQKKKMRMLSNQIGEPGVLKEVTCGLVELPRMTTRKERLRAIPGRPGEYGPEELPLLYKAINEEHIRFGLQPIGRPPK